MGLPSLHWYIRNSQVSFSSNRIFQHRRGMASRWRITRSANVSARCSVNVNFGILVFENLLLLFVHCIQSYVYIPFGKLSIHLRWSWACPCGDRQFSFLKLLLTHGDSHHSISSLSRCEAGTPPFPFLQSSITCVIGFGFGFSFGRSISRDLEQCLPIWCNVVQVTGTWYPQIWQARVIRSEMVEQNVIYLFSMTCH